MPMIDPKLLRQLRESKGLSRQRLEGVSERQLARIEAADRPTQVRNHTLKVLTEALGVSPEVLTGEEPIPEGFGASSGSRVHPHALRALREREGMSRAELAKRSKVPERGIARLESTANTIESATLGALAKALGTDVDTLSRESFEPPVGSNTKGESGRMTVALSPQLRLAYDLIGHRYGPTRSQIIELAPLLFALLAEACLAERRKRLDEVEEAAHQLRQLGDGASQLYFTHYLVDVEYGAGLELESIESADLLGQKVRADDWARMNFEADLDKVTPFADYLCTLADKLDLDGVVDFLPVESEAAVGTDLLDDIWGAEPYQVCGSTLTELTGGSKRARWALAHGDVQLSKTPRELLKAEAKEARVKWFEDRLSEDVREELERRESWMTELSRKISLDRNSEPTPSSEEAAGGDSQ